MSTKKSNFILISENIKNKWQNIKNHEKRTFYKKYKNTNKTYNYLSP